MTALQLAIAVGSYEVVRIHLLRKADLTIHSIEGTAVHIAVKYKRSFVSTIALFCELIKEDIADHFEYVTKGT